MGEKKEDTNYDDYNGIVKGSESKEIFEKKPPNEKILDYSIADINKKKE
ncbi:MAG: hypothetical protein ACFFAN_11285 [Promethearchaeota archaeon]